MIIIIGNQKGGAGKSTMTLVMANYLTQAKNCPVTVIDMDYQQSISQKYEKAKILENKEPYEVLPATLETFPVLKEVLMKNSKDVVLIDLPGKLDDDGLLAVFTAADLFICPFAYDEFTFESTILFTVVLRKVNPKIKMVFIPNRIKANAKFEIMQEVNAQLSKFGVITAVLPDRIDFQRTNTFQTPVSLYPIIIPVFEKSMLIIFMENMKSLADQLRQELTKPTNKQTRKQRKVEKKSEAAILDAILAYDTSINKSMVHVRFDEKTVRIMNQFKMATSVDVSKLVAFAVKHLFDTQPEIKTIIKHFIQNNDL